MAPLNEHGPVVLAEIPSRRPLTHAGKLNQAVGITCQSGAEGSRTLDLLHAMQALSQLSYGPVSWHIADCRTYYTAPAFRCQAVRRPFYASVSASPEARHGSPL